MSMPELLKQTEELKNTLNDLDGWEFPDFYAEVLRDYHLNIISLKAAGETYPWAEMLRVKEELDRLEKKLKNTTDEEFKEYVHLGNLYAALSQWSVR